MCASVKGYVAIADYWFAFLQGRQPLEEVNFWQPSAHGFRAPTGAPVLFKLARVRSYPRAA